MGRRLAAFGLVSATPMQLIGLSVGLARCAVPDASFVRFPLQTKVF
jgi:hypothetical protein